MRSLATSETDGDGVQTLPSAGLQPEEAQSLAVRLFERELAIARQSVDALFRWLIPLQWLALALAVCWVSPSTWIGRTESLHLHVIAVLALGALTALPTIAWLVRRPTSGLTRHAVAVTQMIFAALYIHAWGGRIEAHFAIFVILPLLAAYRDTAVIATGAAVVALDHALRGILFPLSVFGDGWQEPWRWLEHGGYVVVLGVVLHIAVRLWLRQMREITAHRADLLIARETLEEKVAERTRELEVALVDARAGLAARTEFLSNVTHEFRTPLHGIISMTSHALAGELEPVQREAIDTAWRSSRELLGKIDDVLELARTDRERMELREFALRSLLADLAISFTTEELGRVDAARPVLVIVEPKLEDWRMGPGGALRRILRILLDNAWRHGRGAVVLRVSAGSEALRFSVQDDGPGLPPQVLAALRQPLAWEAMVQRPEAAAGLGIGLRVAATLIDRIGGHWDIDASGETGPIAFLLPLPALRDSEAPLCALACRVLHHDPRVTEAIAAHLLAMGASIVAEDGPAVRTIAEPEHLALASAQNPVVVLPRDPGVSAVVRSGRLMLPLRPSDLPVSLSAKSIDAITRDSAAPARPAEPLHAAHLLAKAERGELSVLVVDDNPVNLRVAERLLQRFGWRTDVAASGLEALERIQSAHFDLILMDLRMPDMDGLETTRRLRALEHEKQIARHCVIAFTANDTEGDRRDCLEAGMDEFLAKPLERERLLHSLGRVAELLAT